MHTKAAEMMMKVEVAKRVVAVVVVMEEEELGDDVR
jgi:hypothetical protein